MTLKVIGSGEIVQQVFWLDARSRTCGVMLLNQHTNEVRCSERPVADLIIAAQGERTSRRSVEVILGNLAGVILQDE